MSDEERRKHMSYLYSVIHKLHDLLDLKPEHYTAMSMTESGARDFFTGKAYDYKDLRNTLNGKDAGREGKM